MPRISRLSIPVPAFLPFLTLAMCAQKLPVDEGRMVIALPVAPGNVDPRVATDAYGEEVLHVTHASLVRRDAAGEPVPDLAQRWESPDPLTYIFDLRRRPWMTQCRRETGMPNRPPPPRRLIRQSHRTGGGPIWQTERTV